MRDKVVWASIWGLVGLVVAGCGSAPGAEAGEAVTTNTTPSTAVREHADWNYLREQYSGMLGRECGSDVDDGGVWVTCVGLQNVDMKSFYGDAQTLPMSKARADLLQAIEQFESDFGIWRRQLCSADAPGGEPSRV